MTTGDLVWIGVGVGIGVLVTMQLARPSEASCCQRVSGAVRETVVENLGEAGGVAYDILGLGSIAPGLLDLFGVPP